MTARHGIHTADWPNETKSMVERFNRFLNAEAYLDAAMMLVPEGWTAEVRRYPGQHEGNATLSEWETGRTVSENRSPHPAIALATAALKAKEQP